jgi:nucleoside-diphosphate-sugar epimerase
VDPAQEHASAQPHGQPLLYNIVDDEPASVREWLPVLADVLGAKPPRRVPRWLARLFAGEAGVMMGTEARGASNGQAKRALGWSLRYPSWRRGFVAAYRRPAASESPPRSAASATVARPRSSAP